MNIRHLVIGGLAIAIVTAKFFPFGSMSTAQATDALRVRADERWKLRTAGDWIREYQFLTPARRSVETLDKYLVSKDNFRFFNAKVEKVEVTKEGTGQVHVTYEWESRNPMVSALMKGKPMPAVEVVETWQWVPATDKDRADWYVVDTKRAGDDQAPIFGSHDLPAEKQPLDLTTSPRLGAEGLSSGVQKAGSATDTKPGSQKH